MQPAGGGSPPPTSGAPATKPSRPSSIAIEPGDDCGPSFGEFDNDLVAELVASSDEEPFFMVDLIDFRYLAVYADGRETDLTGREANALYDRSGVATLLVGGMRVAFAGAVVDKSAGSDEVSWEQAAIARYPSHEQFFAMTGWPPEGRHRSATRTMQRCRSAGCGTTIATRAPGLDCGRSAEIARDKQQAGC